MRRRNLMGLMSALAVAAMLIAIPVTASAAPVGGRFQVRHVFVIVLENEDESTSFGSTSPAPYLAQTLVSQGAFLPNYYGIGHHSADNYIAMISGQAPNPSTQADCGVFSDFTVQTIGSYGQIEGSGCVYPTTVPTIASQLVSANLTWRDYDQSMGANPARESATCGHPAVGSADNTEVATPTDMYATRHNPFVYFHSIIDNTQLCNADVVNLSALPGDLSSASKTPSFSFIVPDLCNDGHDSPCADGEPGGLTQANSFLQTWVPQITSSKAFREDGLLIVTFDESAGVDSTSCCGEIPGPSASEPGGTGPGGGVVGAVLLSPCIAPGTVSQTPYNHYTMLGSVENIFGLSHLGYAALPGETYFGSDVYKRQCGPNAPVAKLRATASGASLHLSWSATTQGGTGLASFTAQVREHGKWRTLAKATRKVKLTFKGAAGRRYTFRVQAVNLAGQASKWATATAG